jgi:SAM-dependent methyltransferase
MPARRVSHPVFARYYARISPAMDKGGMAAHRRRLLHGLTGPVIEIGAGNGLNFAHYPAAVTRVLAIEPDPHLREIARRNAAQAPVPVEVREGIAEDLPADDGAFHAAVTALVLCSVADQHAALREIHRAPRPGGKL